MRRLLLLLSTIYCIPAFAYHTGTVYSASITASSPHSCSDTLYDPEIIALPGGDLQLYGQGNNGTYPIDEFFGSRRNQTNGVWSLPSGDGTPAIEAWYSRCNYSASSPGPLASPSIVKVGSTYYMAYSGGNGDQITGRVYWAVSNDGLSWSKYGVNAGAEGITPIIREKYHDVCSGLDFNHVDGVGQVELAYEVDPATQIPFFYFFLRFGQYNVTTHQFIEGDRIAYRIQYDKTAAAGLGATRQIYYNGSWTTNDGNFVWSYDPWQTGDTVLSTGNSATTMNLGAGDVKFDPGTNRWIHFYQATAGQPIQWEYTTTLSTPVWTYGGAVDLTSVTNAYPTATIYYPGVYFANSLANNSQSGGVTGNYVFLPIQDSSCGSGDFVGLRIISAQLLSN